MTTKQSRPDFIRNWRELEGEDNEHYPDSDELMSIGTVLSYRLGLTRIGIHHERLLPGRRMSYPHAESAEEEFVYVLEGHPHAWINGEMFALQPGDAVAFPAGTGICHTFINNSDREARLMVIGEANKAENRIFYPKNQAYEATREDRWNDVPEQQFGDHNGLPDALNTLKKES
ncbi:cupin domain-containing protein [Erwiniaceae bacterium BAC15a-03b]|uniref:Cupin domain-containing protein n=1 Tax=Winslowiella arboricola TaxID=2978220 RepID=A0A9J6PQN5_9GAMM|nr:cupin domain-containing protein [Winslowiella arboricola]MCU5774617.1 cupin domain-containing protein [Winslowiella arboricola]MCU5777973.1 cupin domain-containing protein [Winslowiella arboricola]